MTTINYNINANKLMLILGGALAAGYLFTLGENRHLRKELEERTSHNETNIRFLFKKVKELEDKGGH